LIIFRDCFVERSRIHDGKNGEGHLWADAIDPYQLLKGVTVSFGVKAV
jgi:hypothetical protein